MAFLFAHVQAYRPEWWAEIAAAMGHEHVDGRTWIPTRLEAIEMRRELKGIHQCHHCMSVLSEENKNRWRCPRCRVMRYCSLECYQGDRVKHISSSDCHTHWFIHNAFHTYGYGGHIDEKEDPSVTSSTHHEPETTGR
jgi:hypothetical protein